MICNRIAWYVEIGQGKVLQDSSSSDTSQFAYERQISEPDLPMS